METAPSLNHRHHTPVGVATRTPPQLKSEMGTQLNTQLQVKCHNSSQGVIHTRLLHKRSHSDKARQQGYATSLRYCFCSYIDFIMHQLHEAVACWRQICCIRQHSVSGIQTPVSPKGPSYIIFISGSLHLISLPFSFSSSFPPPLPSPSLQLLPYLSEMARSVPSSFQTIFLH